MTTVTAVRLVEAPIAEIYRFLDRLPNHERLTGSRLRLLELAADRQGARMRVRGPFGLRRTVETTITYRRAPYAMGGIAGTGRRTSAEVHWTLDPAGSGTVVTLTAILHRRSAADRLLLALGGRRWLRSAFEQALAALAGQMKAPSCSGTAVGKRSDH
jgi:hypothetical protein